MPETRFVHLRLHSEYSVTDGIVRLDDAVARAVSCGMPALALTDLVNFFGLVKFYSSARGKGVKPVLGCDVFLANKADPDRPHRMLLLLPFAPGLSAVVRASDPRLSCATHARPRGNYPSNVARGRSRWTDCPLRRRLR